MAVSENDLLVGPLIPAAGVTTISLDFYFEQEPWLEVYKTGSETPLVLNTEYTVAGAGTGSGVVTLTTPANGTDAYSVYLAVPLERSSDMQLRGEFKSGPFNTEMDRLWQRLQYHWTHITRSLRISATSAASTLLSSVLPGQLLQLRADGAGFIGYDPNITVSEVASWFKIRDAAQSALAASLADGSIVSIAGLFYEVDSTATGAASATNDLGVDGLKPHMAIGLVYAAQFGVVADTGTDQLANLQRCFDWAEVNGYRNIVLPAGVVVVDGTLTLGSTSGFTSPHLIGANGSFIGATKLVHGSTQKLNPLLNIRGVRMLRMTDIQIVGNNTAPQAINSGSHRSTNLADYASSGVSTGRYNPYAGITFSALYGADPGAGNRYTFGASGDDAASYGENGLASKCFFERVRIDGFYAAVVVGPNAGSTGLEDFYFRDCSFIENAYGVCTTSSQQRNVVVNNANAQGSYALFDSVTFGDQNGSPIYVKNSNLGKSAFAQQTSTAIGTCVMRDSYLESIRSLAVVGSFGSSGRHREVYSGCNLSLIGHDEDGTETQKDTPIRNVKPLLIEGGSFVTKNLLLLSPDQRVVFRDMDFRVEESGGQTVWGIWPQIGLEENVFLEGCDLRAYSGPTRYINNTQEVDGIDSRARVEINCQEVVDRTTGKRLRVHRHPLTSRGPNISNLTYDSADELSFDYTSAVDKPILVGDLLFWKVWYPSANDATGASAMMPALKITDITGARVTCDILAHIDTSYAPTAVDAAVFNFVNLTVATGDTASGSANITNVTNIGNFEVGDWIVTNDGDLPTQFRVIAKSGTTLTMHRTANRTNTGVQLWNAKLLPHGVKADAYMTYDPASLADGDGVTATVKCRGAALGDNVSAAFSLDLQGIMLTAWVSAANVVSVRFQNETGGIIDLGSGTLKVSVFD